MSVTYTIEAGKIIEVKINGKDIKKSYMNALTKAQELKYFHLFTENTVFQNPFSGVRCNLTPLEASIYNFIISWNARYSNGGVKLAGAPIQTNDNMRYLFKELNCQAYYDLVD